MNEIKLFSDMPKSVMSDIKYVMCDIDDTITTDGKLSADAYCALWELYDSGISVIPVTGRPAGWCDLIVRQWPVSAVIGENGAFVYYIKDGLRQTFTHPQVADDNIKTRLLELQKACLSSIAGCRVAKDQFSRIYDLAIDFGEEPPHLGFEAADKIKALCTEHGATAKVSSIHVNAWFGNYDKLSMAKLFLTDHLGEKDLKNSVLFFGDSPNDEPMFSYFPHSCAVANIRPFLDKLSSPPTYIAEKESGEGFSRCVEFLLQNRG